ncbi:hypothetical protein ACPV5L_19870 [Vibrio astriarenae]|uniref:Uncharacterized protein n=1 Tax=Vibrio agarivorans TaxID=153622 RepID=A0ABT7Y4X4_9VIBR|nr:hypothetical protein [Vibrio agarivorans]MDN2483048.1 hypothetical protein [Vibrio agarivorans]
MKSKKITLVSIVGCITCLVLVKLDILALLAMLGAVFFLFFAVVHGGLSAAGRDDDLFGAFQDTKKQTSHSLFDFFSSKK